MKCLNCGIEFIQLSVTQKYCCKKCGREYRKNHCVACPAITFNCSYCGKLVVTDGEKDKRTRFCCSTCEKKFWKHPHWENTAVRMNFHNAKDYISYEKRTNNI